jgi:hypothetical protein
MIARTRYSVCAGLILLAAHWLAFRAQADEPPEPSTSRKIGSGSCSCWVYTDAEAKATTAYRAAEGAGSSDGHPKARSAPITLWRVPGWFAVAAVSRDCQYLVTGYPGANLLPSNYDRDTIMLSF